jgi:potassium-transporting ATPase KdpC subunit
MLSQLRPALVLLFLLTLVTGVAYPLAVTGVASVLFPAQAVGSLISDDGVAIGSSLIAQPFSDPKYFWPRPSATGPFACNAAAASGSNQGPTNPALADAVKQRLADLNAADPANTMPVPVELLTTSASGIDPHLSPAGAEYQADRVARTRGLAPEQVRALIAKYTEPRTLGLLGEPRVNVLRLNTALDRHEVP